MSPDSVHRSPIAKTRTGIRGFDEISFGGLPTGRATLVAASAGSAKTIFTLEFLVRGIEEFDEHGVFVTFEETPEDICRNARSMGWDLEGYVADGRLAFVDASPHPDQHCTEIGVYDFSALLARVENAVREVTAKRVGVDSVGSLFTQFKNANVVRHTLFRIGAALKQMDVTSVITAERLEEYGSISRHGVEEYVADSVVILRNALDRENRRRTIEILKYRGALHQKGEYPFTICSDGIEIQPLSSMELTQQSSRIRMSLGNTELDTMCGGGIYRDAVVLATGATGTGKTLLVTTFLNAGCQRGERALLFAFEESIDQLARHAAGCGMDLHGWEEAGLLKVVNRYPETMGLEDHLVTMKREIEAFNPRLLAIDSLSALERISTPKSFREFVVGVTSHVRLKGIAGLLTSTTDTLFGDNTITDSHISTITDAVILMRYVELLGEMRRGLTVLKMRGSDHDKSIRDYDIDDRGIHIGNSFREIGGILAGNPAPYAPADAEELSEMFADFGSKAVPMVTD